MKSCLLIVLMLLLTDRHELRAQELSKQQMILEFLGTEDPDELDPDDLERLEHLMERPLSINLLDKDEIRASGLFSAYQIAVLEDYVTRHGGIHSFVELSLLEGFGEIFTRRIRPFISLDNGSTASAGQPRGNRHEFISRGSGIWRKDDVVDGAYGIKYRLSLHDGFSAVMAVSQTSVSSSWIPSSFSGSAFWKFRNKPVRIAAGDFNARFGQGLVLWNNSFMSNLTTPDSFMKKPSGITQPWSFNGNATLCGFAMDCSVGKVVISAIAALPGLKTEASKPQELQFMPALNVAWFGRHGQVSFTNVTKFPIFRSETGTVVKSGLDAALCISGVNVFGEIAYDWSSSVPSAVAGTRFMIGERLEMAVLASSLDLEQFGTAVSALFSVGQVISGHLMADAACYLVPKDKDDRRSLQLKSQLVLETKYVSRWKARLRLSERIRTWGQPIRTDIRADITYTSGEFAASMRLNALNCDRTGFLSYVEGGYLGKKCSVYLRQGIFFIDDWDDRIYVYERDAPGSFNVPAMYGRGVWTSMTAQLKMSSSLRLYMRASLLSYPFMEKKKPGKAELKLQLQYGF